MFPIQLGLKASCNPEQMMTRLKYQPDVFEFFTSENDFTPEGLKQLENAVQTVRRSGVKAIVLHHPMKYHGRFLELVAHPSNNAELVDFIDFSTEKLLEIAKKYDCKVLVHGSYELQEKDLLEPFKSIEEAREYLFSRMDYLCKIGHSRIIFENGISILYSYGNPELDQIIAKKGYQLAYDVSHAFIFLHGDNKALQESLKVLKNNIVHYHLVDSFGKTHDSLTLGHGKVDWAKALPFFNEKASSIYEINLKDLTNPVEQLESHDYLKKIASQL